MADQAEAMPLTARVNCFIYLSTFAFDDFHSTLRVEDGGCCRCHAAQELQLYIMMDTNGGYGGGGRYTVDYNVSM